MYQITKIRSYIRKNKDSSFLALVRSAWHAMGLIAVIKKMDQRGIRIKGLVLIEESEAGILVSDTLFQNLGEIEVYRVPLNSICVPYSIKDIQKIAHPLRTTLLQESFFVIFPFRPHYDMMKIASDMTEKQICAIIIDEGLGTYMRNDFEWYHGEVGGAIDPKKIYQNFFSKYCKERLALFILRRKGLVKNFNLFLIDAKGSLYRNPQIAKYYPQVIREYFREKDRVSICQKYENAVMIVLQKYHVENKIRNDEDLHILRKICKYLTEKGEHVIVKPHPRELEHGRYMELGCEIDPDSGIPAETIFETLSIKPKCIIGITSTVLVTGPFFWNIPAISMLNLFDPKQIETELRSEFRTFNKRFSAYVYAPKTIEEFKEVYKGI